MSEQSDIDALSEADRAIYFQSRKEGSSHRFALMCALQSAPAIRTDSTYFANHQPLGKQFEGMQGETDLKHRLKQARKRGYNPNPNSHYDPAIAEFAGDPDAYIGPCEGRGKLAAVLEKKRVAAEKRREAKAKTQSGKKILAPDIVRQIAQQKIRKNPELARMDKGELAHQIVEQHGTRSP